MVVEVFLCRFPITSIFLLPLPLSATICPAVFLCGCRQSLNDAITRATDVMIVGKRIRQSLYSHCLLVLVFVCLLPETSSLLAPTTSVARKGCSSRRPASSQTETALLLARNASVTRKCCSCPSLVSQRCGRHCWRQTLEIYTSSRDQTISTVEGYVLHCSFLLV